MTSHALLFADVVDSTQAIQRLGDEQASQLWAEHDRRARQLLAVHNGREIDRTDGFFLLFDRPSDAAEYAREYHALLASLALAARVGIHVGTVVLRTNDASAVALGAKPLEVDGLAKPLAARIMMLAPGGRTLLSSAARDALGDQLPAGTLIVRHGHYRLRGIDEPIELFELGGSGGGPGPPPDTDKAYRVARVDQVWLPLREVRNNLSPEVDAFIGRSNELRALASRFDSGVQLMTIIGPAGTGKTRLARRFARMWLGDWPGGVYFCDLSEARSLDGICAAVARALGLALETGEPAAQLGHAIAGRARCLLVLDNFEQVVGHASASVGRWLERAPQAAFAVTSRERLHIAGENLFHVDPLELPTDAIDLFESRAQSQQPDFVVTGTNRHAVAEVVRLLDGLPLAIELAAARVRVLPPQQIIERLRDRFAVLARARSVSDRQATLKAAIDWSWDLLAPWEQAALAQCSAFDGGFTLDAAEHVVDLTRFAQAPPALDVMQALVDKSLLRSMASGTRHGNELGDRRLGMYLSIQEYAAQQLATEAAATASAQMRHGRYFAAFASDSESAFGPADRKRHAQHEPDLDNLIAACRRAVARNDAPVATATYVAAGAVLERRGPYMLCVELGRKVLSLHPLTPQQRVSALVTIAKVSPRIGLVDDAVDGLAEAARLARTSADEALLGEVLVYQGNLDLELGRTAEAATSLDAALVLYRARGDRRHEAWAAGNRARAAELLGDVAAARAMYQASIDIDRALGDRANEGVSLGNLAVLLINLGQFDAARAALEQALHIHHETGNRRHELLVLSNMANVMMSQGELDAAGDHYRRALTMARDIGARNDEGMLLGNLANFHELRGDFPRAREEHIAALAIQHETGDRRAQAISHINLAMIDHSQGATDTASSHLEQALSLCRQTENRRLEGIAQGALAALQVDLGELAAARAGLARAEQLLRQVQDTYELARLLCVRGELQRTEGDIEGARAALHEAQATADAIGAGPRSEIGRALAKLRTSIG